MAKDKRKSRSYIGEDSEPKEPKEKPEVQEPKEQTKKPKKKERKGLLDGLTKKPKLDSIYVCPACNPEDQGESGYRTAQELNDHIYQMHGLMIIEEDVEACAITMDKGTAKELVEATKERDEANEKEMGLKEKRIEATLGLPKELEPKEVVNPARITTPEEIFDSVTNKMADPTGQQNDEIYTEHIQNGYIEVNMIKRFKITQEILTALQTLKMNM